MAVVRLPVVCPVCDREEVQEFELATLAAALLEGAHITLESACHPLPRGASSREIEQIRQYLGALKPRAD